MGWDETSEKIECSSVHQAEMLFQKNVSDVYDNFDTIDKRFLNVFEKVLLVKLSFKNSLLWSIFEEANHVPRITTHASHCE